MVDVTGLGQSTEVEEEENLGQVPDDTGEEITDVEAFWELWNMVGEQLLASTDSGELADFLDAAGEAQRVYVDLTVYLSEDEDDSYSLYNEFDFESEADSGDEEVLDDLEGCDCGDSDEN